MAYQSYLLWILSFQFYDTFLNPRPQLHITWCFCVDHAGCMSSLALLRQLFTTHAFTNQLLDSEHEVGSGIFDPSLTDPEHCNASNTTSWDLSLLSRHYHPTTVTMANHVMANCPTQGENSTLKCFHCNFLVVAEFFFLICIEYAIWITKVGVYAFYS